MQDLIDLAIEYGMLTSTIQFNEMSKGQQAAIIKTIRKVAGV
jgi:hypothetical protein